MPELTILIVDDNRSERVLLKHALTDTRRPLRFIEAGNRAEAIDRFKQHKIDIVFLDIMLPGRNGLDVLGELCWLEPDVFVVMVSHHHTQDYVLQALRQGAKSFIVKPFSMAKVKSIFEKHEATRLVSA